jgi:hypothetical protein
VITSGGTASLSGVPIFTNGFDKGTNSSEAVVDETAKDSILHIQTPCKDAYKVRSQMHPQWKQNSKQETSVRMYQWINQ